MHSAFLGRRLRGLFELRAEKDSVNKDHGNTIQ